jgi:hypothetical protein
MATNTVVDAIRTVASNNRVLLAMLMGAYLESGLRANAVGDSGRSFGPFQIHLPAHPGVTAQQAQDPVFAAKYMLKAYEGGVNRVDPAMWNSNPAMASATAAFYAERPAKMYDTQKISQAWPEISRIAGGGVAGVDSVSNTGGIPSPADMFDTIWTKITRWLYDTFGSVVNYVYFALLYTAGGVTIAVGAYLLFKESTRVVPAARNVVSAYGTVLGKAVKR